MNALALRIKWFLMIKKILLRSQPSSSRISLMENRIQAIFLM